MKKKRTSADGGRVTAPESELLRILGDDAEPYEIVKGALEARLADGRHAARDILTIARGLASRGFIAFLHSKGRGLIRLDDDDSSSPEVLLRLAAGGKLWMELTEFGQAALRAEANDQTDAEDDWRLEEYPRENRVVVYAASAEVSDDIVRRRATRVKRPVEHAARSVKEHVSFRLRGGDVRSGVRVTYRWSAERPN